MYECAERTTALEEPDGLQLYLDHIGQFELLTVEQEVVLAQRIEAGAYAEILLGVQRNPATTAEIIERSLGKNRDLSEEQKRASISQIKQSAESTKPYELEAIAQDGAVARQTMIESNLRLSVSFAKRYARSRVPLEDIIAYGNRGLLRAVDKFDFRQGYKFSTYAAPWIKKYIIEGIKEAQTIEHEGSLSLDAAMLERQTHTVGTVALSDSITAPLWPSQLPTDEAPSEEKQLLLQRVDELPERTRNILMMKLVDEQSSEEISRVTGMSVPSINRIIRTTVARLNDSI